MSRKTVVKLLDDMVLHHEGKEAPATETITFAFGGQWYEMDVSAANAGLFEEVTSPWKAAARKIAAPPSRPATLGRRKSREVRAWAKQRGHKISERGRIPAHIIAEYEADRRAA